VDIETVGIISAMAMGAIALSGKVVDLVKGIISGKPSKPPPPRDPLPTGSPTNGVLRFQCENEMGRLEGSMRDLKTDMQADMARVERNIMSELRDIREERKEHSDRIRLLEIDVARGSGKGE